MLTKNNLFFSPSTQPPFSFASDLSMRRENRIEAEASSMPLLPACVLPPKGCGCLCQVLSPSFLPVFCLLISPPLPEVPVLPAAVAGAEKGLLGHILGTPALTCFGEG